MGPQVASCSHSLSPSLVLNWVLPCSRQDASWVLHVIFQGKDPKTEEFVPPGQYGNVSRDLWAISGGCLWGGGWGLQRAEGRTHPLCPQMKTVL